MHVESIADANAQHRTRHLPVEGPVAEGGPFCQAPFELDCDQVDAHGLRRTIAYRRRDLAGLCECRPRPPTVREAVG